MTRERVIAIIKDELPEILMGEMRKIRIEAGQPHHEHGSSTKRISIKLIYNGEEISETSIQHGESSNPW